MVEVPAPSDGRAGQEQDGDREDGVLNETQHRRMEDRQIVTQGSRD
jgi:hypothetical protein